MASDTPHSAEYFGEQRDFWWNRDFLELMARRWGLPEAPRMLDVGCGVGHWGRLMLSLVSPRASLVGLDREPKWIEEATRIATQRALPAKYQLGDAAARPKSSSTTGRWCGRPRSASPRPCAPAPRSPLGQVPSSSFPGGGD
jgi:SAM-dependent methyltransferase